MARTDTAPSLVGDIKNLLLYAGTKYVDKELATDDQRIPDRVDVQQGMTAPAPAAAAVAPGRLQLWQWAGLGIAGLLTVGLVTGMFRGGR